MKFSYFAVLLLPILCFADAELGSSVESLLEYAKAKNPLLAAAKEDANGAKERILIAETLPDPAFTIEFDNKSSSDIISINTRTIKYGISQQFPLWGKRTLKKEAAAAEYTGATELARATWSDISSGIKTAYAKYYLAYESRKIANEILELSKSVEKIALVRYSQALASQQDVIRAQTEQSAVLSELVNLQSEEDAQKAQINMLLGREADLPLLAPAAVKKVSDEQKLDFNTLKSRLLQNSPELRTVSALVNATESYSKLASKNSYPDINFGLTLMQSNKRIDEWDLMAGVSIPLWQDAKQAEKKEAVAKLSSERYRLMETQIRLLAQLKADLAKLLAAKKVQSIIENTLLPQTKLGYEAALSAYKYGKVDFTTLMDALRQIKKAKIDELNSKTEQQLTIAQIEKILGEEL